MGSCITCSQIDISQYCPVAPDSSRTNANKINDYIERRSSLSDKGDMSSPSEPLGTQAVVL